MATAPRSIPRSWAVAQAVSVSIALAVVALLIVRPELGLVLTWGVLIPAVPALLLVAPRLWRNLCPIAVVHQLPVVTGRGGSRRLGRETHRWAAAVAAAGLFLIVPLRHAVFNDHGPALALFVVVVLGLALAGGIVFAGKSGWCSTFCPVSPVERLYGQEPFAQPVHAHCASCLGCTDPCFDREGPPAVAALVNERESAEGAGASRRTFLGSTATGVFAAAFPGFVLGYFTVDPEAPLATLYLHVLFFAGASLVLFLALQTVLRFRARTGLRIAAATAAGLYYWFTVPAMVDAAEIALGSSPAPAWVQGAGHVLFLGLVAVWLLNARHRDRRSMEPASPGAN